jgi:hypothetical protein
MSRRWQKLRLRWQGRALVGEAGGVAVVLVEGGGQAVAAVGAAGAVRVQEAAGEEVEVVEVGQEGEVGCQAEEEQEGVGVIAASERASQSISHELGKSL